MAYYFVSLEATVSSDIIIKADSEEEARRLLLAKRDDEFDWRYDLTDMTVSKIDDVRGAEIIDKIGGRGTLLPRGIIKIDRNHL